MDGKLEPMGFSEQRLSLHSRLKKLLVIGCAVVVLPILVIIIVFSISGPTIKSSLNLSDTSRLVYNETFGFGEIVLITLPERTDRQDIVSLLASQYNLTVSKTIYGVHGEEVAEKALPYGVARTGTLNMPHLGSWRSHMDAFKYVVDNRIESALIIEDDIDWDTHVKEELYSLSKAMRSSTIRPSLTLHEAATAPYGLDWDIFHLGVSFVAPAPPPYGSLATRYKDSHRNPAWNGNWGYKWYNWEPVFTATNNTALTDHRVVIPTHNALGLVAIAVTYEGARRLMYELDWLGLQEDGIDKSLAAKLGAGKLRGWTVVPPIMSSWKIGGSGDSDLQSLKGPADRSNEDGSSAWLRDSARKALKKNFPLRDEGWSGKRFGMEL